VQIGLGWTALHAGLTILPFAAGTFLGAAGSDQITRRIGRGVLQIGSVLVAAATAVTIAVIHAEGVSVTSWELLPALLIGGIGSGMVIAPNVEVVLSGVPWQDAGSASGALSTAQRLGQSVGIAVVGVALFASLANVAPRAARQAVPALRQQVAATQPAGAPSGPAEKRFVTCFEAQTRSSDPTATPPGCSAEGQPAQAVAAYQAAGKNALARAFTLATEIALLCALGALVLAALLVPLLPRQVRHEEWTG
jgi:MFS family permease